MNTSCDKDAARATRPEQSSHSDPAAYDTAT